MLNKILDGHPLVIVKLGSGGDDYRFIPPQVRRHTILICIDVATEASPAQSDFLRLIRINKIVADSTEPREFIERDWWGSSSITEAKLSLVRKYGLARHCRVRSRRVVTPTTLPLILADHNLAGCDALITDLEGLDLAVIRSCGDLIDTMTLIQSELRFEPFYEGEPHFHEAAAYLGAKNFHLVGLKPERWKPVSSVRGNCPDGVTVWADCTFFREPPMSVLTLAKSVILLCLFGQRSLAAHLLEVHGSAQLRGELLPLTAAPSWSSQIAPRLRLMARALKSRLLGNRFPHVA